MNDKENRVLRNREMERSGRMKRPNKMAGLVDSRIAGMTQADRLLFIEEQKAKMAEEAPLRISEFGMEDLTILESFKRNSHMFLVIGFRETANNLTVGLWDSLTRKWNFREDDDAERAIKRFRELRISFKMEADKAN